MFFLHFIEHVTINFPFGAHFLRGCSSFFSADKFPSFGADCEFRRKISRFQSCDWKLATEAEGRSEKKQTKGSCVCLYEINAHAGLTARINNNKHSDSDEERLMRHTSTLGQFTRGSYLAMMSFCIIILYTLARKI